MRHSPATMAGIGLGRASFAIALNRSWLFQLPPNWQLSYCAAPFWQWAAVVLVADLGGTGGE